MSEYDYLIVGAGTAGCVLAARLSEDPDLEVALIEAGGPASDPAIADPKMWPLLQGREIDWRFETLPQAHTAGRVHAWPRGRVVGGSSCLNAMAHVRGHPSDFEAWVDEGCTGWGFADLLPYFVRSETSDRAPSSWHGAEGPIRLMTPERPHEITRAYLAAAEELGFQPTDGHNGPRMTGPTLNSLTIADGRRQSAADAYLTPALGRANLTLLTGSPVRGLAFDPGPVCRGLWVEGPDGPASLTARRGVLLAAGAIGSPLLLMASGIGPAADLGALGIPVRADLPGVGGNLHDHLLSGGNVYRATRPVPPSAYQHSESLLYVDRDGGTARPELVLACVVVPVTTERFEAPPLGEAYTLMFGFTQPRSRGRVRLASPDPTAAPLIDPRYLSEADDRGAYLDALDLAQAVGHAGALSAWHAEELLPGPRVTGRAERAAFLEAAAFTHHHPVGTCRMGGGAESVVGPDLGVRGVEGLYVIDASVFPRITSGPVNAAVAAVAERASDLLRGLRPLAPVSLPAGS